MRVNARLDEDTERQLSYLTQLTGQSVSHVVRESVARYYHALTADKVKRSKFLALAGKFSSGGSDLSSRVKEGVAEILDEKYRRVQGEKLHR